MPQYHTSTMYTKEDILSDLETLRPYKDLPNFTYHSNSLVASRITLFADSTRWAIVFELVAPGVGGDLILHHFGNCLINQEKGGLYGQFLCNTTFSRLLEEGEYARIVVGPYPEIGKLSKHIKQVKIRDRYVPIEHDIKEYEKRGIPIEDYDNPEKQVDYVAMLRYLAVEKPEVLRATDEEVRRLLPKDLPKLFVIDQWHQREYYVFPDGVNKPYGDKPRSYETYPMIADVLVSRDTTKWKPTLKPTNDWRNWQQEDDQ